MTARPVPQPSVAQKITQDFEANGPLIISQDSRDAWRVLMQGQGIDGVSHDVKLTAKGEVATVPGDTVVYDLVYPVVNGVACYPFGLSGVSADGFAAFTIITSTAFSNGLQVQGSVDGVTWFSLQQTQVNGSVGNVSSANYASGTAFSGSIPACKFIRIYAVTYAAVLTRFGLALSRSPRVDYVATRVSDVQVSDNSVQSNSTGMQNLLIGGADATKRTRVLATDGTVSAKGQANTNTYSGAATSTPFYGHVLTTAIARTAPYAYQQDQPMALQANTRGELSVDLSPLRNLLEQETLNTQAAYMQTLDPNWGFELR